jgi:hypothetical protein
MKNTKLVQTLRTFTKDEMKLFEKFVASPYFNNGRNYLPFLKELQNHYPDFEDLKGKLTSENVYKKLYPGKKFNKQVMWNQVSQLEKLAREFLLQTSLKSNKSERFVMMFNELSKRHLDKQVLKEIEKADKYLNTVKLGEEYFSLKWIVEINRADYWNSVLGRQDKSFEGTVKSTEYLLLKFLADLSIQVWDLNILKIMYNAGDEIDSALELLRSLDLKNLIKVNKKSRNRYSEVINFYYNKIMCALDENDESYFFEMKACFDKNYDLFDKQEQHNAIISLANYCAHKMRLGNGKFLKILFEINKFRLEKEIGAYTHGRISKALFHQILRNALSLGEIKYSENFVKEYAPKLRKEHQSTMTSLALAYISYEKKSYDESLYYLNKVEFIDLRDKLHVRILSAKAYYELNDTESLSYLIDSSKHFIGKNTSINNDTRDACMKFFNFLNKLLTCKENHDLHKLKLLREDIELDKIIRLRHKNWLLEKIEEQLSS